MNNWISIGNKEEVSCITCKEIIPNSGFIDHHGGVCPNCKIQCVFFYIAFDVERLIQVVPSKAPSSLKKFIYWAQKNLDELEFIELLVSFHEVIMGPSD